MLAYHGFKKFTILQLSCILTEHYKREEFVEIKIIHDEEFRKVLEMILTTISIESLKHIPYFENLWKQTCQ